jgi:glycosyltransferase involved in cell wall biosynthesis
MIIGLDGNEANVEAKVGISEFAYELLRQFSEFHTEDTEFRVYLKDQPRDEFPSGKDHWVYRVLKPGKLWTQWRLPLDLYLYNPKPDVFFTPSHYAPRFSPVPTVISLMDVSYLRFPELFNKSDLYQLKSWTSYSVKNAAAVITISTSTRDDIIKEYGIPKDRVHVVYPGIKAALDLEPHVYTMQELKETYGITGKYILFVGTLQPRKNIQRLIEAFSKLSEKKDLQLIIVGKKGWLYEDILAAPEKYGVKDSVKFLDYVPDKDLPLLYKKAVCYVLPSLYEGFGLPVLEAMKYDCPVITSNVSSLPEAGGDAALYIDPENVDDIAEKIGKVLRNETLRKEMIEKGKKQIKKFSWEKAAKETLSVLRQVAGK